MRHTVATAHIDYVTLPLVLSRIESLAAELMMMIAVIDDCY